MTDFINHPPHYTQGGIECIDAMQACSTPEEFAAYLRLAAFKYLWRLNHKESRLANAQKAQWYINRLVQELNE